MRYPDVFIPVISIHPYRKDAIEQLEHWAARGCRLIKWLPNSMNIDPAHPKCLPYYAAMRKLRMMLLCHTGGEHSVDSGFHSNVLGDPLRLKNALDAGVPVIAAHCASEGKYPDTMPEELRAEAEAGSSSADDSSDPSTVAAARTMSAEAKSAMAMDQCFDPSHTHNHAEGKEEPGAVRSCFTRLKSCWRRHRPCPPKLTGFDLFLSLLSVPRYSGVLFGDISAMSAFGRVFALKALLQSSPDVHRRLVYGSDYPVPAVRYIVWTSKFVSKGLITPSQKRQLDIIYQHNPLLFCLVIKRIVRAPPLQTEKTAAAATGSEPTVHRFPVEMFAAETLPFPVFEAPPSLLKLPPTASNIARAIESVRVMAASMSAAAGDRPAARGAAAGEPALSKDAEGEADPGTDKHEAAEPRKRKQHAKAKNGSAK
jgi:hypothetical protein